MLLVLLIEKSLLNYRPIYLVIPASSAPSEQTERSALDRSAILTLLTRNDESKKNVGKLGESWESWKISVSWCGDL